MPGISAVSPPISAQPAWRQPSAMPAIDALGDAGVELAGGEIVEEEQRLGALHDQVVDAHRDQVDADAVVPVVLDRELELGADAVVRRDQQRIGEARRLQIEEAAEAAEIGIGARAARVAFARAARSPRPARCRRRSRRRPRRRCRALRRSSVMRGAPSHIALGFPRPLRQKARRMRSAALPAPCVAAVARAGARGGSLVAQIDGGDARHRADRQLGQLRGRRASRSTSRPRPPRPRGSAAGGWRSARAGRMLSQRLGGGGAGAVAIGTLDAIVVGHRRRARADRPEPLYRAARRAVRPRARRRAARRRRPMPRARRRCW